MGRFPREQRVRKRAEYRLIQAEARRVKTSHFAILLRVRDDSAPARLGLIVSRRVGGAVVRNRAKRLIREAFRATRALWPAGLDVVVMARRPPDGLRLAHVVEQWQGASRSVHRRHQEAIKDLAQRQSQVAKS